MPWHKGQIAQERGGGKKLLSAAYREYLGRLIPTKLREELKLPEGTTFADAIAVQTMLRAIGQVSKEHICFTAITEIRETTEGKTAERIVAAGNEELAALARAMVGEPAPIPDDNPSTAED
jgi:uncharacterized protein (UPF0218 family)